MYFLMSVPSGNPCAGNLVSYAVLYDLRNWLAMSMDRPSCHTAPCVSKIVLRPLIRNIGKSQTNTTRGKLRNWRLRTLTVVKEQLIDLQFFRPITSSTLSRPELHSQFLLQILMNHYISRTSNYQDLQWGIMSDKEESLLLLSRKARSILIYYAIRLWYHNTNIRTPAPKGWWLNPGDLEWLEQTSL